MEDPKSLDAAIDVLQETEFLSASGNTENGHKKLLLIEPAAQPGYFHVACFDQDDEIMDGTTKPISKGGLRYVVPKFFPVVGVLDFMQFEMSEPRSSWNRWMPRRPS